MDQQSFSPLTPRLRNFYHGGDYNPEQWTPAMGYEGEEVWLEDMRLMKLAGVNVATIGVFSWASLQPDEETFTFAWMDRVMDLLAEHGIFVCLGTGTAAQPAWLSAKYPDVLPVDERGIRRGHGMRQNYCPTSPDFRRLSRNLAYQLAIRYKNHPALLLWHVSNEYGGDSDRSCHCARCAERFRAWLRERYGTLDALNQRWMTAFWSHTYTSWEQIMPPGTYTDRSVQGHVLDFQRFVSQMRLECYQEEAAVLREVTPGIPITTNFMGWSDATTGQGIPYKGLDYFAWAPHLDVISWDSYPTRLEPPSDIAFRHDVMRGLRDGQPFLLMEQTPSQVQWAGQNPLKRPGVMRLLSYQAIAHGADAIMYFQWRQSRGSAEMFHGAIVSHGGTERTRTFQEVATLGAELQALGTAIPGTRTKARVALMFSWPNWWNVEYRPGPNDDLSYPDEVLRYYRALWEQQIPVDVISPDHDLSRYDIVLAPLLNMVSAQQAEHIDAFVRAGGLFLTTYFSGVVDEDARAWLGGYPGPLRKTLGIWVEEYDPLGREMSNAIVYRDGTYRCDRWCDVLHLEGATALATYAEDFYAGSPAIIEHLYGDGRAYYVATRPELDALRTLISYLLEQKQIEAPLAVPDGVEVTLREGEAGSFLFVLNHGTQAAQIPLPRPMQDLLTRQHHTSSFALPPRDVAILMER